MPTAPQRRAHLVAAAATLAAVVLLPGCARYQVGAGSLYAPDVRTVYVPMIESESFRPDLGERLTEAVVKEIELKTPFKVVSSPNADSVLTVRVIGDARRTLAEDPFDAPRLLETELFAEVNWLNHRRLPMAPMQAFPVPGSAVAFRQDANFVPAAGQSVAQSQQEAIHQLAQQIVSSMEEPW